MGIVGTLLPRSCKLSRGFFNFSREYFNSSREYSSLWVIKTSLDRNASALNDPEVLFSRVARHLAGLAFCKLKVGIFKDLCHSSIESLSFKMLKSCCGSSLLEDIDQCDFLLLQVVFLERSIEMVMKSTRRSWRLAASIYKLPGSCFPF